MAIYKKNDMAVFGLDILLHLRQTDEFTVLLHEKLGRSNIYPS